MLDTGTGIPAGVQKNLFAPFYTTKGEKGTGLGLWVSRGILDKHEGTIHVSSRVTAGKSGTRVLGVFALRTKAGPAGYEDGWVGISG